MVAAAEVEVGREISEEELRQVRSRATELLLKEDWNEYIRLYSHFISVLRNHHLISTTKNNGNKSKLVGFLCFALSNRAEALHRLGNLRSALRDCDDILRLDSTQRRALLCKARVSLDLGRYSAAAAACLQSMVSSSDEAGSLLRRCRRLEAQSRTGAVDISEWVICGFKGEAPELAEYVGPVEIRRSKRHGGRGLFATRSIDAGTTLFMAKAAVIGRGVLPYCGGNGRLVMWRDIVDRLLDATGKCPRTLQLLYSLSTGEDGNNNMAIPEMGIFQPEWEPEEVKPARPDAERILKILDVNSVREEEEGSVVLGRREEGSSGFFGVGLWVLLSFMNHSCEPNARRVHVGDQVVVHASRDVREGEELTVAYFDVLRPWERRREEGVRRWGFECRCERCVFEEERWGEMSGIVEEMERKKDELVVRLEEEGGLGRRWKEEKRWSGWMRASFWEAYELGYLSERRRRWWGRRVPPEEVVGESVVGVLGGDERVLRVMVEGRRRRRKRGGRSAVAANCGGDDGEEGVLRIGKGVYGNVVRKKQAMKALIEGFRP